MRRVDYGGAARPVISCPGTSASLCDERKASLLGIDCTLERQDESPIADFLTLGAMYCVGQAWSDFVSVPVNRHLAGQSSPTPWCPGIHIFGQE